jgi:tRNA modification GTPase
VTAAPGGGVDDTIAAVATALGRGALAIVRLSGPAAHDIARACVTPWPDIARRATLAWVHTAGGEVVDESIVVRFDAPHSFTGEDAVEITSQGGAAVPAGVLAALLEAGARQAEPGEFTRRAVLNGRVDILQAEATGDLIAATSRAAQRLALAQLDGGLSRTVLGLREQMLELEALIAYDIDFPEEDDGPIPATKILAALDRVEHDLDRLHRSFRTGETVREGALTVLVGAPNTGKSSLFNALIGQRRAIVTPVPGTTRDALEVVVDGRRWPIRLVDTAGVRATDDVVERLGIEVSLDYARRAAVVLVCADSTEAMTRAIAALPTLPGTIIRVATKADTRSPVDGADVHVSATERTGLEALVDAIERALDAHVAPLDDQPVLTNARHRGCIARAVTDLRDFREAWAAKRLPATVAAVHLRSAVGALEDLVGVIDTEDVLGALFSRFCIGK